MTKVLFICLGNICRSPTADAVFRAKVNDAGRTDIVVDSCGTGDWHIGHSPDERAQDEAAKRGYDMSQLRARQFAARDLDEFDYLFVMDSKNYADVTAIVGTSDKVVRFLDAFDGPQGDVPDPYYEGGFDSVFDMIEAQSLNILKNI